MNKLTKLSSVIIVSTLIINSLTSTLSQNNIAHAENNQIKKIINIKNTDILNILEQQYNNNKISEDDFRTIKSIFQDRWHGPNGQTKIVIFWDGAFDLYLNSYYSLSLVGVATTAVLSIIGAALIASGASAGTSIFVATAASTILGMIASTEVSNGIIIYFKKVNPSLGNWNPGNYYPAQIRSQ